MLEFFNVVAGAGGSFPIAQSTFRFVPRFHGPIPRKTGVPIERAEIFFRRLRAGGSGATLTGARCSSFTLLTPIRETADDFS